MKKMLLGSLMVLAVASQAHSRECLSLVDSTISDPPAKPCVAAGAPLMLIPRNVVNTKRSAHRIKKVKNGFEVH